VDLFQYRYGTSTLFTVGRLWYLEVEHGVDQDRIGGRDQLPVVVEAGGQLQQLNGQHRSTWGTKVNTGQLGAPRSTQVNLEHQYSSKISKYQ
jgi:hypothetical protein